MLLLLSRVVLFYTLIITQDPSLSNFRRKIEKRKIDTPLSLGCRQRIKKTGDTLVSPLLFFVLVVVCVFLRDMVVSFFDILQTLLFFLSLSDLVHISVCYCLFLFILDTSVSVCFYSARADVCFSLCIIFVSYRIMSCILDCIRLVLYSYSVSC